MWYDSRMSWDDRGERQRRCTGTGQEWQEPGRAYTCGLNPPREPAEGTVRTLVTRDALGPDEVAIMSINRLKPWRQRVRFIQLEWRHTLHTTRGSQCSRFLRIHLENTKYWCLHTSREYKVLVWSRIRMWVGLIQDENDQIGYQSKGVQKLNTDLAPVEKILCPQMLIQKLNLSSIFIIIRTTVHEQSVSSSRTAHERVSEWDSTRSRTAHARGLCDIGEPE